MERLSLQSPSQRTRFKGPFQAPKTEKVIRHTEALSRIASLNAVMRYFSEKYPHKKDSDKKKQLCADAFNCQAWTVEPELMQDLIEARLLGNKEKQEELRKCLRAVSWQDHPQADTASLVKQIEHIKHGLEHEAHMANAIQPDDAEGWLEQAKESEKIIKALKNGKEGSKAEPAAEAIEDLLWNAYKEYQAILNLLEQALNTGWDPGTIRVEKLKGRRAELVDRILGLRQVRDQIYFQELYSDWYISSPIKKAI